MNKTDKHLFQSTRTFMEENISKSWLLTLSTFCLFGIAITIILLDLHWSINAVASICTGLLYVRLFVIYHDYLHGTILKKSKIAKAMFTVFGYYMLTPKEIWRKSHNFHHRYFSRVAQNGIGSYPLVTKQRFETFDKKEQRKYLFSRHPLVILFGYYFTFLYGMCLQSLRISFSKHKESAVALLFHITIHGAVLYFFGWQTFIWASLIPNLMYGAIGAYLFYAQHNFPEVNYNIAGDELTEVSALQSSSFLKTTKVGHWITGNIGFHHIHHANVGIPFYRLPEVMNHVSELQNPKTTSFRLKDIYACLQLKYWDTELNKMVRLNT